MSEIQGSKFEKGTVYSSVEDAIGILTKLGINEEEIEVIESEEGGRLNIQTKGSVASWKAADIRHKPDGGQEVTVTIAKQVLASILRHRIKEVTEAHQE